MKNDQPAQNELSDLDQGVPLSGLRFYYDPQARLPVGDPARLGGGDELETTLLAARRILHMKDATDGVIRRGKVRISEFLPNGNEVTRAILQSGSVFAIRRGGVDDAPMGGGHDLGRTVVMALEETEVWILPPGRLAITGIE